jgi:uncharacterized protein (DUF2237 family)
VSETLSRERNVLGGPLRACSYDPLTGYFRDGCCAEFLVFSREHGNDLSTPRPEMRFRGLKPGDRWCLHVLRWVEAWEAGKAPPVVLEATHQSVLQFAPLTALKRHALNVP